MCEGTRDKLFTAFETLPPMYYLKQKQSGQSCDSHETGCLLFSSSPQAFLVK